jgi:nucleoside-diphosphate-sugar epimerase
MKLAVFGANGPTGRLLTRLALGEDHDVVAFTRHPDAFPIEHPRLEIAAVSAYRVAADHIGYRFTARIDLADCLLREALDDAMHARPSPWRRPTPSRRC